MEKINDGGPAFPFEYHNQTSRHQEGFYGSGDLAPGASQQFAGMSYRQYLIGQALAGYCANPHSHVVHTRGERARFAIIQADEVLDALEADEKCRAILAEETLKAREANNDAT